MTKCALGKVMRLMVSTVMAASLCPAVSYAQEFELPGSEMGVASASGDKSAISNPADGERADAPSDANESGANASSGQVAGKEDSGEESPAAAGVPVISEDESSPVSKTEGEGAIVEPEPTEPAGPEEKPGTPLPDGSYVVVPACSASRCLDVAGGSSADGADVRVWASNMTGAQRVVAKADAETGLYELTFAGTGKALDVSGAGTAAGTNVQQWTANGAKAQRWAISENADGTYSVESALAEGLSLDVAGAGDFDGAGIDVWPANGTAAQRFSFVPAPARVEPAGRTVDDGVYELVGAGSGKALDVSGASRADGANVQVWTRNDTGAQKWRLSASGSGWQLLNCRSKKALDVDNAGSADGTNVQQWSSYGNAAQTWSVEYAGGGAYKLVNAGAGKPLDVAGAGGWDGANVAVWSDNGTLAQRFRLVPTTYTPQTGAYQRSDGSWDWYNSEGDWDRDGAINRILSTANSLLGVPYVWLGVYPQDGGMDCASFTWYLYRQLGIDIGFETYDQMYSGVPVWSLSDAKPGDLVLMYDNGWPNYVPGLFEHVVLYAGNGMIYEEPTFGGQCQYVSIWSKGMGNIKIRRILAD